MTAITQRDRALFHALGKYGLLTTTQLSQRIFPGVQSSTVLRRLRALEEMSLIYRVRGLDSGEMVWILSREGESLAGIGHPMIKPNRNGLAHDVRLTELRIYLEAMGLGENFVPEWAVRRLTYNHGQSRRGDQVVPDGIFSAMTWKKEVVTVAMELEISGKNTTRYEKVFARYMEQSHLRLVWYFVKTRSFGDALQRKWKQVGKYKFHQTSALIFTVLQDFEANQRKAKIHFESGNTNLVEEFFALPEYGPLPAQAVGTPEKAKIEAENSQIAS